MCCIGLSVTRYPGVTRRLAVQHWIPQVLGHFLTGFIDPDISNRLNTSPTLDAIVY